MQDGSALLSRDYPKLTPMVRAAGSRKCTTASSFRQAADRRNLRPLPALSKLAYATMFGSAQTKRRVMSNVEFESFGLRRDFDPVETSNASRGIGVQIQYRTGQIILK